MTKEEQAQALADKAARDACKVSELDLMREWIRQEVAYMKQTKEGRDARLGNETVGTS